MRGARKLGDVFKLNVNAVQIPLHLTQKLARLNRGHTRTPIGAAKRERAKSERGGPKGEREEGARPLSQTYNGQIS